MSEEKDASWPNIPFLEITVSSSELKTLRNLVEKEKRLFRLCKPAFLNHLANEFFKIFA